MRAVHFTNDRGTPTCENYLHLFSEHNIELVQIEDGISDSECIEVCKGADAILTALQPFPRAVVEKLDDSVKAIVRMAMGYEIIDLDACNERKIYVCNVPDYAMEEVAVMQAGLILDVLRKITYYDKKVHEGHYDHVGYTEGIVPRRASTLSLGLLGFGRIAKHVATYMKAFGMRVFAYDPFLTKEIMDDYGVIKVETKEEIFETCDIISPNIPLTKSSYHIIDEVAFSQMKDGVIIVNNGRGPLIDQNALVKALQSGKVLAAGLDVFEEEPLPMSSPLLDMENVVLTPHASYLTVESVEELQRKAVEYTIEGAEGKIPAGAVNKTFGGN